MKFKHIHFIINPASGKEEPILSYINEVFANSGIKWDVSVTKKGHDGGDIAKELVGKTDLIVAYGGDGCITEVAGALQGAGTPMAIIPGGTANVMAKELGIPQLSIAALQLLKDGKTKLKPVDMGLVNKRPFLLRVNLGIMADMVTQTTPQLKDSIGQLAYGVTAIKTIAKAEQHKYRLIIDGSATEETGVSLTVTNSGNIGIGDYNLLPGIRIDDGLLDIILLKDNDFLSVLKVAGSTLLQNESDAYKHWRCRRVVISMDERQSYVCDDAEKKAKKLTIEVAPAAINIVVPLGG